MKMRRSSSLTFCPARTLLAVGLLGLVFGAAEVRATEYVAFGDSITLGTGDDIPVVGYPGRLQALLRNTGLDDSVRNEGLGAEKTPEGLSRLNSVLDRGGDVLLLMEGSNDISVKISRETTLFNLGKMAERAEARGLEAIHVTMIPRSPRARVDAENLLNQRLIESIRHLAGLNQRRVIDNFEIFGIQPDWFAKLYSQDPLDFVGHPNPAGYDLMASTFFDVLTEVDSVPPVTGILSPWNGANNVKPSSEINVELWDFGVGIDIGTATLIIDGQPVTSEVTGGQRRAQLRYASPKPLRGVVTVGVQIQDLAAPANAIDREVARFVIAGTAFIDGDIDQDGRVDGVDLVLLARGFGSTRGESRYQSDADLDGDGAIDGKDLAILATTFGESL